VTPSSQGRHIRLGPGLVDEDQPFSFEAVLILCLLDAPPPHVGMIALASHHAFSKAGLLSIHEIPHLMVVDVHVF
jgi:hypothetical protein